MTKEPIHLEIPFYRQHYEVTCGPAALMMAMKYFDNRFHLTKDLEIDIWREANMVEVYGTSRFGLAYSAAVRGLCAKVISNTGKVDFVDRLKISTKELNMQVLNLHFNERRTRCKKLGVKEEKSVVTNETIHSALASNHVLLLVTNALFCAGEDLPHWIAVTGMDDKFVYYNNPLDMHPRKRKFDLSSLSQTVGYCGDQSMVEVWRHR